MREGFYTRENMIRFFKQVLPESKRDWILQKQDPWKRKKSSKKKYV